MRRAGGMEDAQEEEEGRRREEEAPNRLQRKISADICSTHLYFSVQSLKSHTNHTCVCFLTPPPTHPPPPLGVCLLYSRLVLNLQKFIRYKLLLPSYSFIALDPLSFLFLFPPSSLCAPLLRQSAAASSSQTRINSRIPRQLPRVLRSPGARTSAGSPVCFRVCRIGSLQNN